MKSAYIYVRVSTDEQKNRGFSLIEQEDRLLKYCEYHQINVLDIFREDHSAKTFDRPEWEKLLKSIRKNKERPQVYILFLKWDRFSRNTEYSYQMLGLLRSLNVRAMAIDQQCDPNVPENKVVLAMFLSMPEAENIRRGKNTSDGMRRARLEGRWPNSAPTGYANMTTPDGKKIIVPKYPEAEQIQWAFKQFAKGSYTVSQVRKAICLKGFECAKSSFYRVLRNPAYCGIVVVAARENDPPQFVKGIHEPLVSEKLFQEVQILLMSKRRQRHVIESKKHLFPLRGFLKCPYCDRKLTGSISSGRHERYRYYHCITGCPGRFNADDLDNQYTEYLKNIRLNLATIELFKFVLEDENIFTARKSYLDERNKINVEILAQQSLLSNARRLFVAQKIDFDDFDDIKNECKKILNELNDRLTEINNQLTATSKYYNEWSTLNSNIYQSYNMQDYGGKRYLINLFSPTSIDPDFKNLNTLKVDDAIRKIIV